MAAQKSSQSIPAVFAATVERRGDTPALGFIRNGELQWRTWREVADDAQALAAAQRTAGIRPGDRVAQVSENRYEWIITDLACHFAEAVHVAIHVTLSGTQIAEQIADSDARLVLVSSRALLARFAEHLPASISVWVHDEQGAGNSSRIPQPPAPSHQPLPPHTLATILYTSGTTGRPRGVMLSQENLLSNAAATADAHEHCTDQLRLNILPLSHIFARTCDLYTWVTRGSRLVVGESRETLHRDCQLARPTALSAVPYVFQRISDRVRASGTSDEAAELRAFFGGRIEQLICGGAPLPPDVEAWFAERGLPLLPGYGLTEASPVISLSMHATRRVGSVGRPLANVETRIAADGELLVRGPSVMLGYWNDEAATADAIRDGWLHTGDLAELDGDGFLTIRGRKKELLVLSTGKKVMPSRVESLLTASPLIEQAAVFGEGQSALTALVVPTTACGLAPTAQITHQQFAEEIERCLAIAAHEEQVRHFAILDRPFSIEKGELTAKLSLCRTLIARNFAAELAAVGATRPALATTTNSGESVADAKAKS